MKQVDKLILEPRHVSALDAARIALDHARSMAKDSPNQRGMHGLHFSNRMFAEILVMVILPTFVLLWYKLWLVQFWASIIMWWSKHLGLSLNLVSVNALNSLQWSAGYASTLVPTAINGVLTASLVIAGYVGTFWMSDRQTPLKYVVRALCLIQTSALLFFMFSPSMFSYTHGSHITAMLDAGYYLMLAIPLLLAFGWGVLNVPTYQKLLYPILMLIYFALMVPHKAILHAFILQHFSVLFMPILYLCFGTVFDLLVFVALYSWLASIAPLNALKQKKIQ